MRNGSDESARSVAFIDVVHEPYLSTNLLSLLGILRKTTKQTFFAKFTKNRLSCFIPHDYRVEEIVPREAFTTLLDTAEIRTKCHFLNCV